MNLKIVKTVYVVILMKLIVTENAVQKVIVVMVFAVNQIHLVWTACVVKLEMLTVMENAVLKKNVAMAFVVLMEKYV